MSQIWKHNSNNKAGYLQVWLRYILHNGDDYQKKNKKKKTVNNTGSLNAIQTAVNLNIGKVKGWATSEGRDRERETRSGHQESGTNSKWT